MEHTGLFSEGGRCFVLFNLVDINWLGNLLLRPASKIGT